jgi:hypothetical protein
MRKQETEEQQGELSIYGKITSLLPQQEKGYGREVNQTQQNITPIGITDFRNTHQPFGIKDQDRFGHIYAIGKTGTGKSTLLLTMAISDIQRGNGICLIDPHGDIAETILNYVPQERIQDVIYVNPKDTEYPIGFNPFYAVHPQYHHVVASGLIATFKKIWAESWGPRLEYILRQCTHTLLEYPRATLLDIQPLLTDKSFRDKVLTYTTSIPIHSFWKNEFEKYSPALKAEAITPILNKVGVFASSPLLRNIVGQTTKSFNMQKLMDEGRIVIVNLSKGEIGEDITAILGSMIITSVQLGALYRSAIPEEARRPFYLYVDEMHSFVSLSFADILSEARKYKLSLFLTHQYVAQVQEKIHAAIIGNVGTMICFRVGSEDALQLKQEFQPYISDSDLIALPRYSMYIKLMIDGATSKPFSAKTVPLKAYTASLKPAIIDASRKKYGTPRATVEKALTNTYDIYIPPKEEDTLF